MAETLGASFSIDVTQLKAGLTQANRLIRESESEFKSAAAGMDDWTSSEEGLTAKLKSLNSIASVQREKVKALTAEYDRLIESGLDPASAQAVKLRTDINNQQAALKKTEGEITKYNGQLKNLDKESKNASKSTGSLTASLKSVAAGFGKAALAATATAAAAFGTLVKKSLDAAGQLEQNLGGSQQVFKDSAGKMQKIAEDAYKNMGLSQSDFLANANKMGALFQGSGFGIEESADMSAKAMQRAADVASIMGIDVESAMEAVAGAAKGNFTMMDNLGVAINDTAIGQYALSKGINKTTAQMSTQEKVGLAMEMFMEKTSYAAGNYAKENETLAGSLGTAKAAFDNFLAGTGTIDQLADSLINAGNVIIDNVVKLAPQLVDGITKLVQALLPQIPPLVTQVIPVLIEGIQSILDSLIQVLPMIIDAILQILPPLLEALLGMTPQILTTLLEILTQVLLALAGMIPTIVDQIMAVLPVLINALIAAIPQLLQAAITLLMAIVQAIPTIVKALVAALPSIIQTITSTLLANLPALINAAIQLFFGILQAIPEINMALIQNMPQIIATIVQSLIEGIPEIIKAGGQLIEGLWEGIKNMGKWLGEKVSGFMGELVGGVKKFFGIESPSKLFEDEIGKNMALGIGEGFSDEMKHVNADIRKALDNEDIGITVNAQRRTSGVATAQNQTTGGNVVVNQYNTYSQAHSRYELYKSRQQTAAAVRLALAEV